jgi:hypothetical protein
VAKKLTDEERAYDKWYEETHARLRRASEAQLDREREEALKFYLTHDAKTLPRREHRRPY